MIGQNILVSSANFKILLDNPVSKSLMKIRNKSGPSKDPVGHQSTPVSSWNKNHQDTRVAVCLLTKP